MRWPCRPLPPLNFLVFDRHGHSAVGRGARAQLAGAIAAPAPGLVLHHRAGVAEPRREMGDRARDTPPIPSRARRDPCSRGPGQGSGRGSAASARRTSHPQRSQSSSDSLPNQTRVNVFM